MVCAVCQVGTDVRFLRQIDEKAASAAADSADANHLRLFRLDLRIARGDAYMIH